MLIITLTAGGQKFGVVPAVLGDRLVPLQFFHRFERLKSSRKRLEKNFQRFLRLNTWRIYFKIGIDALNG